ncbi:MAG: hypothetical protein V3V62_14330 [bacterium]
MRQATAQAIQDLARHGEAKRALVMYHLTTASGRRVFVRKIPPDVLVGQSGRTFFLDGTWVLDGAMKLGEGSDALLGVHNWVLDAGRVTQGGVTGLDPLEAFRSREVSSLSLTLSNEPDVEGHPRMTRLLAQEPVIGGRVDVRVGFEGQDLDDVLLVASFAVRRVSERRGEVVLECEGV